MTRSKHVANLTELDVEAILKAIASGRVDSQSIVQTYINRIHEVNHRVRAVGIVNQRALHSARELDARLEAGDAPRKLHGLPILIKDIFNTLEDDIPTTGGSYALAESRPKEESVVIKRLREAGAIILGKTNLSEWGNSRSPDAPNGWSPIYGQCYGAFHERQDPQGSSSGSAVAASLTLAAATIGGETFGSITYPAQRNSVVGLKPTVGLTPRTGVIPINKYQDSVGPITRKVKDAAIILEVISGRDKDDPLTEEIPFSSIPDYVAACQVAGLVGTGVATPWDAIQSVGDDEVISAFKEAIFVVRELGGVVNEEAHFKTWTSQEEPRDDPFADQLLAEGLESCFSNLELNPNNITSIHELVQFTQRNELEENAKYGCEWLENAAKAVSRFDDKEKKNKQSHLAQLGLEITELLDNYDCDVLMVPTSTDIPYDLGGNPAITVPLGFYSSNKGTKTTKFGAVTKAPNIPFSVMFVGRKFSEEKLLAAAYAFEQATLVGNWGKLIFELESDLEIEISGNFQPNKL